MWSCLSHVPLQFCCDTGIRRFLTDPLAQTKLEPKMLAKSCLKASTIHLSLVSPSQGKDCCVQSNAWKARGTLRYLDSRKGLLLVCSALRMETHSPLPYSEELHWRKHQYGFVAKPCLISWGMRNSTRGSLAGPADPE